MDAPTPSTPRIPSLARAIASCVLIAGTLDIADALLFYGLRGTPPQRLLQVIASGLLGPSALHLGLSGAFLGLAIHYSITCAWATLFILVSLRYPALRRRPGLTGPLYGLLIYLVMNFVVLPHTRVVGHPVFKLSVTLNAIAALVLCMGLPIAIISRRILSTD
jgi:uncharacterized membrane protein YagU involved in acid resistance